LAVGLLVVALGGCGGPQGQAASDCSLAIRTLGIVYVEAGSVRGSAEEAGRAEYASCDDNGREARGAYFPDNAREVRVFSFEGQDPGTVLGVRESDIVEDVASDREFRVFVADGQNVVVVMRAVKKALRGPGK
jgi:Family of unknown function (DUF6281)